jgi:hypothetical protein
MAVIPQGKFTTGVVEMFDGTTDGGEAYLDTASGETNLKPKKIHHVTVYDIRTQEPAPQINEDGYEVLAYPTALTEEEFMTYRTPEGKQMIKDRYWPELQKLILEKTGATEAIPWHFSLRNQTPGYHPDQIFFMKTGISQPASTVHIDNDHTTAIDHMNRELGEEKAKELVAAHKRWAIINVWRPVGIPVQSWPLLVVDRRNVPNWNYPENTARVYRTNDPKYYKAHDNFLKFHPDYIYRYADRLSPEEVIMFKDYDSRTDRVRGTPHGGFQDDNSAADAPPRRSIEVRLFVFFDDEE